MLIKINRPAILLGIFFAFGLFFGVTKHAHAGYSYNVGCDSVVDAGSYYTQRCYASTSNNNGGGNIDDTSSINASVPADVDSSQITVEYAYAIDTGYFSGPGFNFSVGNCGSGNRCGGPQSVRVSGVNSGQPFTFTIRRLGPNGNSSATLAFRMMKKNTPSLNSPMPTNIPTQSQSSPKITFTGNGNQGLMLLEWGADLNLLWKTTGYDSCNAEGDTDFSGSISTNGSKKISNIRTSKFFKLTCANTNGSMNSTIDVKIIKPPIPVVTITANDVAGTLTAISGADLTVKWSSILAENCVTTGDFEQKGSVKVSDSITIKNIQAAKIYSVTCTNPSGSKTATVKINIDNKKVGIVNYSGVAIFNSALFIADTGNNRILKCAEGNATKQNSNCDEITTLNNKTLSNPTGVSVFNNALFIADTGNNRVLNCPDSSVVKQGSNLCYEITTLNSKTFSNPTGVSVFNNALFIADTGNNRVLQCASNTTARENSICYEYKTFNNKNLSNPIAAARYNTDIVIADTGNNRILKCFFNLINEQNSNCDEITTLNGKNISNLTGMDVYDHFIFADTGNNRILNCPAGIKQGGSCDEITTVNGKLFSLSFPSPSLSKIYQASGVYISPEIKISSNIVLTYLELFNESVPKGTNITYQFSSDVSNYQLWSDPIAPAWNETFLSCPPGTGCDKRQTKLSLDNIYQIKNANSIKVKINLTSTKNTLTPRLGGFKIWTNPIVTQSPTTSSSSNIPTTLAP